MRSRLTDAGAAVTPAQGLFDETTIAGMALPNRFVRSGTSEWAAGERGVSTPRLERMLVDLAEGGVGLIVTGAACVSRDGVDEPALLWASSDEHVPGLAGLTRAVHAAGGRIALQLAHAGVFASPALSGVDPLGPSPFTRGDGLVGHEMDERDLAAVVEAFAAAARRARAGGFDAVQVHAAHGGLLSQFLSPFFNRREDAYGRSVAGRTRLLLEVVSAVREAVGSPYPVLVKLNACDFLPGGLSETDMLQVVNLLDASGCVSAIELSGGTGLGVGLSFSRQVAPGPGETEAYYEGAARRAKQESDIPLILVGGIRTYGTAERLVAEGVADYIALSRPLIREPRLIARWRGGDRTPALCVSDNACFESEGTGLTCVAEERLRAGDGM